MKENNHAGNETIGVIYSIMQHNFDILKERKNPVYVKYLTHVKSKNPTRLKKNDFLLFYLSRKNKSIIAFSKINNVSFKTPLEIKQKQLNQIQMDREEFNGYILDRDSKLLIFLELDKIITLNNPVCIDYPITMAGQYVSFEEFKRIIGVDVIE